MKNNQVEEAAVYAKGGVGKHRSQRQAAGLKELSLEMR